MSGRDPFRDAALAYLGYGIVYWVGGVWLVLQGVGVSRGRMESGAVWVLLGLAFVALIPWLLAGRRAWFERWVLARRDFARLLAVLMAVRAVEVLRVALRAETATVAAPGGGEITFRLGAAVFFVVTVVALGFVVRAAWGRAAA